MKKLLLPFLFLLTFSNSKSAVDSVDVWNYEIHVDTVNSVVDSFAAHTLVTLTPGYTSTNTFTLDLLKLTIDSISVNGVAATWSYDDTLIAVHSLASYNPGDTVVIHVWYQGTPQGDASGWGGFYLNNNLYAYNLGVGFAADPHTYGRVWFPCRDNFTDKATFDFYIHTSFLQTAVCNGLLVQEITNPNGSKTYHWKILEAINTYLASMAVSDYVAYRDSFLSMTGDTIPIAIYVRAANLPAVAGSFVNLQTALSTYETNFGPYRFERIGFVGVPFNSGAMEHATNIAYPVFAINGNTSYEYLWAHELSHMWFGDNVTCETAEDMWLNEGFASFCESLFMEGVYGTNAYKDYARNNHLDVLKTAHLDDAGWRAVSGVPHDYTYGTTVYSKGASVAHSLRHYIGSTAFWSGIRDYMEQKKYSVASSDTLKNHLEISTGIQLDDFFDGWVYAPGFTNFAIDSFTVTGSGPYSVTVHVRQKQRGPAPVYDGNRIEITFMDSLWNYDAQLMTFSGATGSQTFTVAFNPVAVMQDIEEGLLDAATDNYFTYTGTSNHTFPTTYFSGRASSLVDSAFVRITHNWVAPDTFPVPSPGIILNNVRYWTVEGIFPTGFVLEGTFNYNGTAAQYLDNTWMVNREDSLILYYRENAGEEWAEVIGYSIDPGANVTDKVGSVIVTSVKPGEYALGGYKNYTAIENPNAPIPFSIYPNPGNGNITLDFPQGEGYTLRVINAEGKCIRSANISKGKTQFNIDLENASAGVYIIELKSDAGKSASRKYILEK